MSASLVAHALRFRRADAVILDGVSLTIGPRTRVGVVGDNGSGKTTLLRLLAGELHAERGTVKLAPPTATVGYLPQEAERGDGETVRALLHRRTGVTDAEQALARATDALAARDEGADDLYSAALERWLALGGSDLDARIGVILADVGLPADALDQRTSTLSGGQAARVSLAAILLARFDVFLLDEPTNDLDFAGLDRLEEFVSSIAGGVAIVSHDRAFLERTITSVLEIDDVSHHATLHEGGWLAYLDARATARRHAEEAYAEYTTKRDRLVDRGRRQKQWAADGKRAVKRNPDPDKNVNAFRIASSEKQASKVKITDRALERLEVVDKPWEGWELHLELATAPRSGAVVFRLDDAVIERGTFRLGPLDLEIGWAERAAILGPNGSGKTTLLERAARPSAAHGGHPVDGSRRRRGRAGSGAGPALDRRAGAAHVHCRGRAAASGSSLAAREVRARCRGRREVGRGPVARRAHSCRARVAHGAGHELPRARRAHEPPRPPGHRTARAGARHVGGHAAARDPRPALARDGASDAHDRARTPPTNSRE